MDALSDILQLVQFKSNVYFRSDFSSPWGMNVDAGPFAQFHLVVSGQCWLQADNFAAPLSLSAGDIVMFPLGDSHWLADDSRNKRTPGKQVVEAFHNQTPLFQNGVVSTTLVCGHFEFQKNLAHPFMTALPRFIHIPGTERRHLSWLEAATNVIIQEAGSDSPGSDIVSRRLAEVLFIQILRAHMLREKVAHGFFAALSDGQINAALALIHSQPQNGWTLEGIARTIGMSRSSFAARFKLLVGMTPMNYLTNWRMQKARDLLRERQLPLIDIAEQVGYTSEAAFSRAFKRQFKQNPGAWRRRVTHEVAAV